MTKEESQLTEQELNQIRAEADKYADKIIELDWRDNPNKSDISRDYEAAATKYQERIKKLETELEGMYALNKEGWGKVEYYEKQLSQERERVKPVLEALEWVFKKDGYQYIADALTNYNESLKG